MKIIFSFCAILLVTATSAQDFWEQTSGPPGGNITALVIGMDDVIFAATQSGGLFRSTDNGDHWPSLVDTLFSNRPIRRLLVVQGIVFAAPDSSGLLRSIDNGNHWNKTMIVGNVSDLAVDSNGLLYAVGDSVWRSADNGATWVSFARRFVRIAANSSGELFAIEQWGVFHSTDQGQTWSKTSLNTFNYQMYHIFITPSGTIIVSGWRDIMDYTYWRSTDGGVTWGTIHVPELLTDMAVNANNYMFVATETDYTSYRGVNRSTNNGGSWTKIISGLTHNANVLALNKEGYLFAGTRGGGVFRSKQTTVSVKEISDRAFSFSLSQNYPNPVAVQSTLRFSVPEPFHTTLSIYNIYGREVARPIDRNMNEGTYESTFDASQLPSGVYSYTLRAGKYFETKRMVVTK